MKRTRLQLHITPEEIIGLANSIKNEFGLYMTMMNYNPFSVQEKELISLDDIAKNGCRILFSKNAPNLKFNTSLEFINNNQCFVGIEVGRHSAMELEESSLFFVSKKDDELKISNKIIYRLKKTIYTGAMINNPRTKSLDISAKHKYTNGAKVLYDMGVKMSSIGGGVCYELGVD